MTSSSVSGILQLSPDLSGLDLIKGHKVALEGFGKKLDDKAKNWRSIEVLMSAKLPAWNALDELAEEMKANNDVIIVLTEGLVEAVVRAALSLFSPTKTENLNLRVVSSSISNESLWSLLHRLRKQRVSILFAFHGEPSDRLLWCFEQLYRHLSQGRRKEEVQRRVVVAGGKSWLDWAKKQGLRSLNFPERSAGRYLFFSEPVALALLLSGVPAWQCVEGGRSFVRTFDKKVGSSDQILAYAALREIQLTERCRESLLVPDDTFADFANWWILMSEDSRQEITEDQGESRIQVGSVLRERSPEKGRRWLTEIVLELGQEPLPSEGASTLNWPKAVRTWGSSEPRYESILNQSDTGQAQPGMRVALRRLDPMSIGALFAFFEGVASASHKLADLDDAWDLLVSRTSTSLTES